MKFTETQGEFTQRIRRGGAHKPLRSLVELCKELDVPIRTVQGKLKMGGPKPALRHFNRGSTAWYEPNEFKAWWAKQTPAVPILETRHCDECKHFNDEYVPGAKVCEKNHKPRWYKPRNDNPHDMNYGWKRRCEDYEVMK